MRKSSFDKNHAEFESWIRTYGDLLERIIEAKRIVHNKDEKMEIVEAFVLRCAARWEVLVEQDTLTSLNRDSSKYAATLGLRLKKHPSLAECKAMLYGHRYFEFGNTDGIRGFAKSYLVPKFNPFGAITRQDRKRIDDFLLMRNFLAHHSDFSKRRYYDLMSKTYGYQRIPKPGAFLMATTQSGYRRWISFFLTFLRASESMLAAVT